MTNEARLNAIIEAFQQNRILYVQTAYRTWKITAKTFAAFERTQTPLFKLSGASLYMRLGKRYDCIDYCRLTVAAR